MSIDLTQFVKIFLEEAREHLDTMESNLLAFDFETPDAEVLNAIFRAAHSIKGGAATFGFADVAGFTHTLETLLDRARNHELELDERRVDACLRAVDVLSSLLFGKAERRDVAITEGQALATELGALAEPGDGAAIGADGHVKGNGGGSAPEAATGREMRLSWVQTPTEDPALADRVIDALSSLGDLRVEARAEHPGQTCTLVLQTTMRSDEVTELLSFVLDPATLQMVAAAPEEEAPAYGLFDNPVTPEAYGLFDEPAVTEAYGLFDDTPTSTATADDSFGFFDDTPTPAPASAASVEPEAYGFFDDASPAAAANCASSLSAGDDTSGRSTPEHRQKAVAPASRPAPSAAAESSIRVSTGKVDQLINLVGELVITQSMLLQSAQGLDPVAAERMLAGLNQLERNSRDLQEAVLSIRMVPMSFVFSRFPRMVRDLAKKLDKQAELQLVGESTELDKGLIEKIVDPLTHLVRNAVDHGLEPAATRLANGKPAGGRITLSAAHQSGSILLEISDDGAGLDRERILAKAQANGLAVGADMSDAEVWELIFAPGFSTAEEITDVSGRGVGMDVVRKNIQALGGSVHLSSTLGHGTRVSIRLPLTLAILDGMSIRAGSEIFIAPLGFVVESIHAAGLQLRAVGREGRVVRVRDEYLPVASLAALFGIPGAADATDEGVLVIVEAQGRKLALAVDELVGQHQVVIKSLETNYRRVAGICGATILGDGQVSMILDVPALIGMTAPAATAAA